MEIIIVCIASLTASALTLFSGFGLGTLLMPVVAIFFPVEIAIAVTAMVHLANNLFKAALLGGKADPSVLFRFGVPAVLFAFIGAWVLGRLAGMPPIFEYAAWGRQMRVSPVNLMVGLLILCFVVLELSSKFASLSLDKKYQALGGAVSGFFGGLSGHQGAFRSLFLLKAGLDKERFIATGVMLAVMVDMSRLLMYGWEMAAHPSGIDWRLVSAASVSAFAGAYFGAKLVKKLTIRAIQGAVSVLLSIVALGLISGAL